MIGKDPTEGLHMEVSFCGINFQNPVMTCSGTFGSGAEYGEFVNLSRLGAVVTKGVSRDPWEGNSTPRLAETPSGMLNAIGLQNPGIDTFVSRDLPFLAQAGTKVIVNVCGHSVGEYKDVVERLSEEEAVDALEINISCPNVKQGGIVFGTDPKQAEKVTREVKAVSKKPIIMKLSPNVTSIPDMARACEAGGADGLSLINTITGMKIDVKTRRFVLANKTGGLSGPAVHPVAVRMVYEAAHAVKLPIIGMGGIVTAEDAIEMMLAGATAIAVGTANFRNPRATEDILAGMAQYMRDNGISDIRDIIGAVE